jgi:NAD(P)H-hydrate epimerase
MGDVLSGIIGGFLAQGLSPWQASCLGVYSHGLAADRLAEDTSAGYLASEVADEIPYVLEKLRNTL